MKLRSRPWAGLSEKWPRFPPSTWALVCLALGSGVAQSQGSSGSPKSGISSSIDAISTYAVNSRLGGLSGADLMTELRPGLSLFSRSGRVVGSLSYSLGLANHTRDNSSDSVQNNLRASLSAEAVPSWVFIDASASIGQQVLSPNGVQSVSNSTQYNSNRAEVGNFSISPYVRGVLGTAINYEARLNASVSNTRRSIVGDSSLSGGSLSFSSALAGTELGWGLLATSQTTDFRSGRQTSGDRLSATLSYNPDVDLTLTARAGQEASNVTSLTTTRHDNYGLGVSWRPTPRTRAQFDFDERYFGRAHRVLVEHRMASSSLQFSSSRDVSNPSTGQASSQAVTLYQVYFAQAAGVEPDPVLREQFVLAFMRAQGLDPNALVSQSLLNTGISVQERHQLSWSYSAMRMAGSLQIFSSTSKVIDAPLSTSANQESRQWGYMATASYRLTPTVGVALTGSRMLTQATLTRGATELKSLNLSVNSQLARRTTATLAARYTVFNSTTDPYREAAVTVSLGYRF